MSKSDEAKARELRLAEKLRENLRRRKAQLKARGQGPSGNETADGGDDTPDAARPTGKDEAGDA